MNRNAAEIFLEVREMPEAKRTAYLFGACGKDLALRAKVEALLKADAEAGSFLAAPSVRSPAPPDAAAPDAGKPGEEPGAKIGRYRLLEKIGEGGMGTIWMAEQREPVRRRVALKIIKLGMDTKQVVARFEAERQALAMMDHPNIAKVLDAGATEMGRPYFVMEYIKGIPILEYCDQEKVDTRTRLVLFISVCHAIQHAHHKGIIHRDIKPSNVLVTLHDGVPVPKVIDFGIAKATNHELTTKTLFTEHRQMIGTPAYMSPEQAEMSGLDIDTRSDVYSLGVLLYELLTGTTPFDMKSLLESGLDEMLRAIREDEPHKPSTRISTLGRTGTKTAQQRRSDVRKLQTLLRGDLDWIVMKCLEKDRTRRYDTANGLAADLARHLNSETVTAGAPSAAYRLRKFVRRNRVKVIAASAVMAALLVGLVGTAWGLVEKSRARSLELARQLEEEQQKSAESERLRRTAAAVAALLDQCEGALHAGDASQATVALEAARKRSADQGAEEHAGRLAHLATDLGLLNELDAIDQFRWTWSGNNFGHPAEAAKRMHEALRRSGVHPESGSVADATARVKASAIRERIVMVMNGLFLREHDSKERGEPLLEVLRLVDADPFRDEFRGAVLAHDLEELKRLVRDPELLEQPPEFTAALGQSDQIPNEQRRDLLELAAFRKPSDIAVLMTLQAMFERGTNTTNDRIRWLQAALAADPQNFAAYINLGGVLVDAERFDEAVACHRKAIEITPGSAQAWTNLGAALERQAWTDNGSVLVNAEKRDEAIACYRKAIELDPNYDAHFNLGLQMSKQGKADEAIACYRRSIELDPSYARTHGAVAEELWKTGQLEEAIASFRRAFELDPKWTAPLSRLDQLLQSLGRDGEGLERFQKAVALDPQSAWKVSRLGDLLRKAGRDDAAIAHYRKAIELDPKHDSYGGLGVALRNRGEIVEATACLRKSAELRPDYIPTLTMLSECLARQGQTEEALSWARKAVEIEPKSAAAQTTLGGALGTKGEVDQALVCIRKAIDLDPKYAEAHHALGAIRVHSGRPDQALPHYQKAVELDPKRAEYHCDLGHVLQGKGDLEAAFKCFETAVTLNPKHVCASYNLGCCLQAKQRWEEAVEAYEKTIAVAPEHAEAHCNMASCLQNLGRLAEALDHFRRGHELGSKRPGWQYPSAQWVREAEMRVALEAKLPAILEGKAKPKDNGERLEYVIMCSIRKLHGAAAKLTVDLFAADPRLADDVASKFRYNSAICAALAGTGNSEDAPGLDDAERARMRKLAIDWLRADLVLHEKRMKSGKPQERAAVQAALREWQTEPELACIRDPETLDLIPEEERGEFDRLWKDVAALLSR